MKTKVWKSILPAMAMFLAIGMSFATVPDSINQTGYFWNPNTQQVETVPGGVDCLNSGSQACIFENNEVFADLDLEIPLYKR